MIRFSKSPESYDEHVTRPCQSVLVLGNEHRTSGGILKLRNAAKPVLRPEDAANKTVGISKENVYDRWINLVANTGKTALVEDKRRFCDRVYLIGEPSTRRRQCERNETIVE